MAASATLELRFEETMTFRSLLVAILLAGAPLSNLYAQAVSSQELSLQELQNFSKVFEAIQESSYSTVSREQLLQGSLREMVREADPLGGVYDVKSTNEAGRNAALLGLSFTVKAGQVVVTPMPGGPAEAAGVLADDVVTTIDDTVLYRNLDEVIRIPRGAEGTIATLAIVRGAQTLTLKVERKKFGILPAAISVPTPGFVVLALHRFDGDTLQAVAKALTQEWQRAPFKGLVLDLRKNPGGFLKVAVGTAALFLPPHTMVAQVRMRRPADNETYWTDPKSFTDKGDPFTGVPAAARQVPLVVLVDGSTSSGAELVAAALKDHKRAKIVGHQTGGVATIGALFPLSLSSVMKLTDGYWFPPSQVSVDKVGLTPDVLVSSNEPKAGIDQAIATLKTMSN